MSCFKAFGPPIESSSSGETVLDEYLICFEDGRLTDKWLQRITLPCGCTPTQDCCNVTCAPCSIPKQNLTFTISGIYGTDFPLPGCPGITNFSYTYNLNYVNGSNPSQWISPCFSAGNGDVWLGAGYLDQNGNPFYENGSWQFILTCSPTGTSLVLKVYFAFGVPNNSCTNDGSGESSYTVPISSFTCSPLSFTYNNLDIEAGGCCGQLLCTMPGYTITDIVVNGPTGPPPMCCITICATLCGSPVVGATITVVGNGLSLSCLTSTNGCCLFDIGSPGTFDIYITYGIYSLTQLNQNLTCCYSHTYSLTNYENTVCCGPICPNICPIPTTLYWTDSNGTFPLIYTGQPPFQNNPAWYGCEYLDLPSSSVISIGIGYCQCVESTIAPVFISLICNNDGTLTAKAEWQVICCGEFDPIDGSCGVGWTYADSNVGIIGVCMTAPFAECMWPYLGPGLGSGPFITWMQATNPLSSCSPFTWSGTLISQGQNPIGPPLTGPVMISQ